MWSRIRNIVATLIVIAVIIAYAFATPSYQNADYEMWAFGFAVILFGWTYLIKLGKHLIKVF